MSNSKEILHDRKKRTKSRSGKKSRISIDLSRQKKDFKLIVDNIKRDFKTVPISPVPGNIRPMLAKLIKEPFNDPEWLFEIKWDGYRSLAYLNDGQVQLRSRNNLSFNNSYKSIIKALKEWPVNAII